MAVQSETRLITVEGITDRELGIVLNLLGRYGFDVSDNAGSELITAYRPELVQKEEFKRAVVGGTNGEETNGYGGFLWGKLERVYRAKQLHRHGRPGPISWNTITSPPLELFYYGIPFSQQEDVLFGRLPLRAAVKSTLSPALDWIISVRPDIDNKYDDVYFGNRSIDALGAAFVNLGLMELEEF